MALAWYWIVLFVVLTLCSVFVLYIMNEYATKGTMLGNKVDLQKQGAMS